MLQASDREPLAQVDAAVVEAARHLHQCLAGADHHFPGQRFPLGVGEFGEAQTQIGQGDMPPLPGQPPTQMPDAAPQRQQQVPG